jgi:DHA1 family multidrug resistance protein-like MFS transporter
MSPWRKTFYAAFIGQFFSITGFFFVMPLLPLFLAELHPEMSQGELAVWSGRVRAVTGLTMAVFAPIWGIVADRYGRKSMVIRAMLGGVVVLTLTAFARNVNHLLILRAMQGCITGTMTASVALVSSVTPREKSGYTLGMMQAAVFAGATLGPFLGGEVAQTFGFKVAFHCAALILFAGAMIIWLFAKEVFVRPPPSNEGRFASVGQMFGTAGFAAALFTLFLVRFGNSAFHPIFPYFLRDIVGVEEGIKALTGRVIGVSGLAAALSAGLLGRVSDRWGPKYLLVASVLFAALATVGLGRASSVPQLYLMRALFGFAAAGIMPSANAIIRRIIHEKHLGKAYGIMASTTGLGWGLGSLCGGWVAAEYGLRAPFMLTAAILGASVFIVVWRVNHD